MEPTKFDLKYAAVRRAVIEQRFSNLNDKQREAVFATEGPLLILAGAGSGKTTVLINRIINILRFGQGLTSEFAPAGATEDDLLFLTEYLTDPKPENRARAEQLCAMHPARPWEVIAITFTNKAARELRERLTAALDDEKAASAVWAYTFHTACLRILRRHSDLLGFETAFTIYDEDDKKRVITGVLKRLNLDTKTFDPRTVMNMISRAKDKLMTPKQFAADASGDYFREKVSEVYKLYEKEMKKACALDFDDIIMKTVLLLQSNPEVLEYYQHQFRYVLVDEYQDTNYAQYVLTSLLAGYYENICVVGDDDQSIYKFRGATITNILEFEKQFKDAKDHPVGAELPLDRQHLKRRQRSHPQQPRPQGQGAVDRPRRRRQDPPAPLGQSGGRSRLYRGHHPRRRAAGPPVERLRGALPQQRSQRQHRRRVHPRKHPLLRLQGPRLLLPRRDPRYVRLSVGARKPGG